MLAAGEFDLYIDQGATYSLTVSLKDSLDAAIDLTGHVFRGQIRDSISGSVVASLSFQIQSPETDGVVVVTLPADVSSSIELPENLGVQRRPAKFVYDIESVSGSAVVRWLEGVVYISPEVTR